jgi:hypothetical protein
MPDDILEETLDATTQIIRTGSVVEDLANPFPEVRIGFGEFGAPLTTGSVTVPDGAEYIMTPTGANGLQTFIGAFNGEGAITVTGADSRAEFQSGGAADAQTFVIFGADEATSMLNVSNGGTFALTSTNSHTENMTSASLVNAKADAEVDAGTLSIIGFDTAFLRIGGDATVADVSLRNNSLLEIDAESASQVLIGEFGGEGRLLVEGGSQAIFHALDEMIVGNLASWDPALQTRGELVVHGAGSRVMLMPGDDGATGEIRTTVGGEEATGLLHVTANGRFEVTPAPSGGPANPDVVLTIGDMGNGEVLIDQGGVMDLGGIGDIQVGVLLSDAASTLFPMGRLTVDSTGSELGGFEMLRVGHDPADIDPLVTLRGAGTLTISNGGAVGDAGAQVKIGVMGNLKVEGAASVTGDIVMRGGQLGMMETSHDSLDVQGNRVWDLT